MMVHAAVIGTATLVSTVVMWTTHRTVGLIELLTFGAFTGTAVEGFAVRSRPSGAKKLIAVTDGPCERTDAAAEPPTVERATVRGFAELGVATLVATGFLVTGDNAAILDAFEPSRTGPFRWKLCPDIPRPRGVPAVRGNSTCHRACVEACIETGVAETRVPSREIRSAPIQAACVGPAPKSTIAGRAYSPDIQETVGVQTVIVHVVV